MNFLPMVMTFDGKSWKPVGRPGFMSQNGSSLRVFSFKGKLYLFVVAREGKTRNFNLHTYVYEK